MTPTSAIEFLIWLLIAASIIAVLATRFRIPYTVALVLGGLALGSLHFPIVEQIYQSNRPDWLNPDTSSSAGGGDVLHGGRDPGVQPGPSYPTASRVQALADQRVPEAETPAALGRGD